jgi:hypothetical protein
VELDGDVIRAKHLYTRTVSERRIEDVQELLTMTNQARNLALVITEAWLGRIRGVKIRFRDERSPWPVMRSDPAMANAKELILAIIYRMSQVGELDLDVEMLDGTPLVRRVFWKKLRA